MHMEWLVGLVAVFLIFGGGNLISKWIEGENEAKRIRAENQFGKTGASAQAMEELRKEVAALRETTTRFDMSFDAAISRLEQRMERVEGQTTQRAQFETRTTAMIAPAEAEPQRALAGNHRG